MPLGDELLENFNTRALPQSGRVMSPEEEAAEMERMLTEDGERDDVTAKVVRIVKADIERGKEVNEAESAFPQCQTMTHTGQRATERKSVPGTPGSNAPTLWTQ